MFHVKHTMPCLLRRPPPLRALFVPLGESKASCGGCIAPRKRTDRQDGATARAEMTATGCVDRLRPCRQQRRNAIGDTQRLGGRLGGIRPGACAVRPGWCDARVSAATTRPGKPAPVPISSQSPSRSPRPSRSAGRNRRYGATRSHSSVDGAIRFCRLASSTTRPCEVGPCAPRLRSRSVRGSRPRASSSVMPRAAGHGAGSPSAPPG